MKTNPNFDISYKYESNICNMQKEDIIDHCYQLDENEIPFRYRLKNINKIILDFRQKVRSCCCK
jgi:hypothetical protein